MTARIATCAMCKTEFLASSGKMKFCRECAKKRKKDSDRNKTARERDRIKSENKAIKKAKIKAPLVSAEEIAVAAKASGVSYGKYVAAMRM